ncbi:MAG: ABC transporter ATP-binding protein [Methylococcaceae bacterium]|jgi:NitT/TauT family transport system ATP-binding protein
MTAVSIDIKNKAYAGSGANLARPIISNFKLNLEAGEFVCLVGPSGCGKTTLLNIIAHLDTHYEGAITSGQENQLSSIGYVFQNPRLLPWRSVRQNIELVQDGAAKPENIDKLLAAMQLSEYQHFYPEQLSLGMSRRVAITRAFSINPVLLLMDEPFVSLDAPTARQVRELLLGLWQQRPHTVLFVTHDLREAITLADRLVFLSASPMQIVSDLKVTIPRDARADEAAIEDFRQELLHQHPAIKQLL